jgi:FixJ family two-component response regulator
MDAVTFTHGDEFLAACESRLPACLLLDLHMPDLSGFEILERVAARRLPVLVITGHDQPGNAERVRASGGLDYFLKPVNESQLLNAIRAALKHSPGTIAPGE